MADSCFTFAATVVVAVLLLRGAAADSSPSASLPPLLSRVASAVPASVALAWPSVKASDFAEQFDGIRSLMAIVIAAAGDPANVFVPPRVQRQWEAAVAAAADVVALKASFGTANSNASEFAARHVASMERLRFVLCGQYRDPKGAPVSAGSLGGAVECADGHRVTRVVYRRPDALDPGPRSRRGTTYATPSDAGLRVSCDENVTSGVALPNLASLRHLLLFDVGHNGLRCGPSGFAFRLLAQLCRAGDDSSNSKPSPSPLTTFNVAYNAFYGGWPRGLRVRAVSAGCPRLRFVVLSANNLQGRVPRFLAALRSLEAVLLDGNDFAGFEDVPTANKDSSSGSDSGSSSSKASKGAIGGRREHEAARACAWIDSVLRGNAMRHVRLDGNPNLARASHASLEACVVVRLCKSAGDEETGVVAFEFDNVGFVFSDSGASKLRHCLAAASGRLSGNATLSLVRLTLDVRSRVERDTVETVVLSSLTEEPQHVVTVIGDFGTGGLSRAEMKEVATHLAVRQTASRSRWLASLSGSTDDGCVLTPFADSFVRNVVSVGDNFYFTDKYAGSAVAEFVRHSFSLPFQNRSDEVAGLSSPRGRTAEPRNASRSSVFFGTTFHMGWGNHDREGQAAMMTALEGERWNQPDRFFAVNIHRECAETDGKKPPVLRDVEVLFADTVPESDAMGFGRHFIDQTLTDRRNALAAASRVPTHPWTVVVSHYPLVSGSNCRRVMPSAHALDDTIRETTVLIQAANRSTGGEPQQGRRRSPVALVLAGHEHYSEDAVAPLFRHLIVGGFARFPHVCPRPVWSADEDATMRRNGAVVWTDAGVAAFAVLRATQTALETVFISQHGSWMRVTRVAAMEGDTSVGRAPASLFAPPRGEPAGPTSEAPVSVAPADAALRRPEPAATPLLRVTASDATAPGAVGGAAGVRARAAQDAERSVFARLTAAGPALLLGGGGLLVCCAFGLRAWRRRAGIAASSAPMRQNAAGAPRLHAPLEVLP